MRPAGDAKKTNVETVSLILYGIGSVVNVVEVVEEGATAGEVVETIDTETLIEVADEGLIGEDLDIQDHHHHVGVTLEIVVPSGMPLQDLTHTCQVGEDEITGEGLQPQNHHHLRLLGPCRTRARRLAGAIGLPQDPVPRLADVGLDRQTDVAIEMELVEGEGTVHIVELDADHQHLRMRPSPVLHLPLEDEDPLHP